MARASQTDAALMLQLAQWGTALGLEEALAYVWSDGFDEADAHDPTTLEGGHVQRVLEFFETLGTLFKHRLISDELVFDWLWVAGVWARVGPVAVHARERFGEPRLYENFEAMAHAE